MSPSRSWVLRLIAGSLAVFFSLAAAAAPRVAIVVTGSADAADWQSVLTAGLSHSNDWTVVERAELSRLWQERAQLALTQSADTPAAPASVEIYLHARRVGETRWIIDVINAADGVTLASGLAEPEQAAGIAGDLEKQSRSVLAAALVNRRGSAVSRQRVRVAVVERGAANDIVVPVLALRLRGAFAENHLVVLDRALTQELAIERNDAERGFRVDTPTGAFLGVDYWIELTTGDARVVRAVDGVVLGARAYDPAVENEVDALQRWAFPLMLGRVGREPAPYLPTIEIEALVPFYRGLVLYDGGRFAEATAEFSRAYQLNGRFREAFEWEARCYEALDMAPLATAVRRYVDVGLLENISSAGARIGSGAGVAFLGVVGWDGATGGLSASLSAQAASALAKRDELQLRIPEQLDELRRGYDWMSGVERREGVRWEQAPELFCRTVVSGVLSRTPDGLKINWSQRDTLGGQIVSTETLVLGGDPAGWTQAIGRFLKRWPDMGVKIETKAAARREKKSPSVETTGPETAREFVTILSTASGHEANVARLKLALIDPGHPLVVGRVFRKGQDKERNGLDGFIEYAMREWLISQLPVGGESRRWLELACLQEHLAPMGEGKVHAGREVDGLAGLREFIDASGIDPAGLVARYQWLYAKQARLPLAELVTACTALRSDVQQFAGGRLPDEQRFANMIESLERLARIAGGETAVDAWGNFYDQGTAPHPSPRVVNVKWTVEGRLELEFVRPEFSLWHLEALDPSIKAAEARAALALSGRGRIPGHFDESWFTTYPRSLTLCAYIGDRFNNCTRTEELPVAHAFDWASAAALRSRCVEYTVDTLEYHLLKVKTADELRRIDYVANVFFSSLNTHDLLEAVPDDAYEKMRGRILAPYLEAKERLKYSPVTNSRLLYWPELTRESARRGRKDHLRWPGNWVEDRDLLVKHVEALERNLLAAAARGQGDDAVFNPTRWWDLMRRWELDAGLTAPELAELYRRRTPDVLRRFAEKQPTATELPKLYEQALVLFYGRIDDEAEQVFRRVLATPSDVGAPRAVDEYRANAAFRLAQLLRLAGRTPEALEMANRSLELDRTGPHRFISERDTYIWNGKNLAEHVLRLLHELRYDPSKARLPARVGVASVSTPNGDNPRLHVFYRQPPEKGGGKATRHRVLVVAPVHNQDALDYLRADSPWARFADEHGLVLVVPQFYMSDRIFRADHRFTHVRYAQIWSGDALLRALDDIDAVVPIEKGRLLVHGVASGSGFACHLAAWRPDLVAAVSVNNGNWGMPRFRVVGLHPMSDLVNVRYFITASAEDTLHDAYDCSVDFVTRLRGAGVSVEWRVWPGDTHTPTAEMEAAARVFLSNQLSSSP